MAGAFGQLKRPGINDNGSGAVVLETAVQLGNSPHVSNAVRFAFSAG